MSNPHNLEVGQKLFRVTTVNRSRYGNNERWETVAKVGRKWATLEGLRQERVSLEDLRVDGGIYASPAQCYLTEAEYREKEELQRCWGALRSKIAVHWPGHVTADDIKKAAELLGIDLS